MAGGEGEQWECGGSFFVEVFFKTKGSEEKTDAAGPDSIIAVTDESHVDRKLQRSGRIATSVFNDSSILFLTEFGNDVVDLIWGSGGSHVRCYDGILIISR